MRLAISISIALWAGCGNKSSPVTDGPPGDAAMAMVDAPSPDAPADPTVRVHLPTDIPALGFDVLFYAPDNHLIAMTSPVAGIASAMMPAGGIVIVIPDPAEPSESLRAVFGVEPGDDLDMVPRFIGAGDTPMSITVPDKTGTFLYRAGTRCGSAGAQVTTFTMFRDADCQPPLGVLVQAMDEHSAVIGAFRDTAASTTAATLAGPYLDPETVSLAVTTSGLPVVVSWMVSPVLDGRLLGDLATFSTVSALTSTTLSLAVAPATTSDARQRDVLVTRQDSSRVSQRHQKVLAANQLASTFDTVDLLPWYDSVGYDTASRAITLGRSAGASLDGQFVVLRFIDEELPSTLRAWNCQLPPEVTQVVLPILPAQFAAFDPNGPFLTDRTIAPQGIRSSEYAGYRDYRRGVPRLAPIGSSYDVSERSVDSL